MNPILAWCINNQRSDQVWGNGSASAERSRAASESSVQNIAVLHLGLT